LLDAFVGPYSGGCEKPISWDEPFKPGNRLVSPERVLLQPPKSFNRIIPALLFFVIGIPAGYIAVRGFTAAFSNVPWSLFPLVFAVVFNALGLGILFYPYKFHAVEITRGGIRRIDGAGKDEQVRQWPLSAIAKLDDRVTTEEYESRRGNERKLRDIHHVVALLRDGTVVGIVETSNPGVAADVMRCVLGMMPATMAATTDQRVASHREAGELGREQELRQEAPRATSATLSISGSSVRILDTRKDGWPVAKAEILQGAGLVLLALLGVGVLGLQLIPATFLSPGLRLVFLVVGTARAAWGARWFVPAPIEINLHGTQLTATGRRRRGPSRMQVQAVAVQATPLGYRVAAIGTDRSFVVLLIGVDEAALRRDADRIRAAIGLAPAGA
jgi:hypothetical protein